MSVLIGMVLCKILWNKNENQMRSLYKTKWHTYLDEENKMFIPTFVKLKENK